MAKWVRVEEPSRRRRRKLNKQLGNYRMAGELDLYEYSGENIPVRAGQYWETPGALMEIVSFDSNMGVGVRRWKGLGKKLMVGNRLTLNSEDIRGGGSDHFVSLNDLRGMSSRLATVTATQKDER